MEINIEVENFLAIKRAKLKSEENITVVIAPNKSGKTQLFLFLYSFLWSLWRSQRDAKPALSLIESKIKDVFLIKKPRNLTSWNAEQCRFRVNIEGCSYTFSQPSSKKGKKENNRCQNPPSISKSPLYIQGAGLGDYYKGIFSLKKYYSGWRLVTQATTDLLNDLFIVASEENQPDEKNSELIEEFEKSFKTRFFVQNERIYIQEKGRKYMIERAASGLKSLAWFYLILRYNLLGEFLFIDEPEVNLHPELIDELTSFICKLSEGRKVFVSTHSDYLIESLNKSIQKHKFKADVWQGLLEKDGAIYNHYKADSNTLIDTTPLNETYAKIVKEMFEYEGEL